MAGLTPAAPGKILAAKFLLYPALGVALAALPGAVSPLAALGRSFFWIALLVAACGVTGVGLTIAGLARTQRAASLGALGYLLAAALLLVVCRRSGLAGVAHLFLESHSLRVEGKGETWLTRPTGRHSGWRSVHRLAAGVTPRPERAHVASE